MRGRVEERGDVRRRRADVVGVCVGRVREANAARVHAPHPPPRRELGDLTREHRHVGPEAGQEHHRVAGALGRHLERDALGDGDQSLPPCRPRLDVLARHASAGSGARDARRIHVELTREGARGRRDRRGGPTSRRRQQRLGHGQRARHRGRPLGPVVLLPKRTHIERLLYRRRDRGEQRPARHGLTLRDVDVAQHAARRCLDLHLRLLGLDDEDDLALLHRRPDGPRPGDDPTLAHRHAELRHRQRHGHGDDAQPSCARAAATTASGLGR